MAVTLEDAWDKLAWAKHHFEELRPDIEAFEKRDSHTITCRIDANAGLYSFHVNGLELTDPDWGLRIGDCLNNARSALDYLMVRLAAYVTGKDPREIGGVQFPISEDPEGFRVAKELRDLQAFEGYLTRIKELQPFNVGNESIWGVGPLGRGLAPIATVPEALRRLSYLNNIDKHRVVHAAWIGGAMPKRPTLPGIPSDFRQESATHSLGPFEDGAQVGTIRFRLPLPRNDWMPAEVDMQQHFRLSVSFADPFPFQGVLEVLPFCLGGVEQVLRIFEPVFTHGEPPLPVTVTLPKRKR